MHLEIVGLNLQGDGYGFLDNKKVIIPKTAKGDVVEFKVIKDNKDSISGEITKIIKKSTDRINNVPCSVFDSCGGCDLLHLKENIYYDFKKNIVENAVQKSGFNQVEIDFKRIEFNARRRVTFKVKDNRIGFFQKNSNTLIEINSCPLIVNEVNDMLPELRKLAGRILINEISITSYENGIEIILNLKKELTNNQVAILKDFIEKNPVIILSCRFNEEEPSLFMQKTKPTLTISSKIKLELEPNIFLQATSEGQAEITKIVLNELKDRKSVLDLYSGVGSYTFPLAEYTNVHSVEGSEKMVNIIRQNVKNNNLNGKITTEVRNLVARPFIKDELNKYDGVVINPPRNGSKAQSEYLAKSNIKKIVMVSCNPQAFIIDANILRIGDYKLEKAIGIDQFYRTKHLEVVGYFTKI